MDNETATRWIRRHALSCLEVAWLQTADTMHMFPVAATALVAVIALVVAILAMMAAHDKPSTSSSAQTKLDAAIQSAKAQTAALEKLLGSATGLAALAATAKQNAAAITTMEAAAAKAKGTIDAVNTTVNTLQNDIGAMKTSMTTLQGEYAGLTDGTAELNVKNVLASDFVRSQVIGWTPTYNSAPAGVSYGDSFWISSELTMALNEAASKTATPPQSEYRSVQTTSATW